MATCIITLKDIMVYQNEVSARESGGLTPSELFQVKDMMAANQISNLSDLNTILTRIFRENGETVLDVQAAYDSGLYSLEEMKNLDIDLVDEMLDKINYTLSKGDVIVELTDNEKAPYKDSSRTTALGTYVQVGTDRVLEDLQKNINNFQDEAEFYSKVKELPYTDFVEKFYEDKDFADSVIQSFKNLTRIPVITISGESLSQDNIETSEVLSNTLRTDIDFIQMEADVEYLIDIDNDVWDDSPNEIRGLLSRLEKTFASQSVDIVGISKKFSNRVEVKSFLSELKDFLRNVEDRNVGQKEIVEFSKKYDDFFGKKAATTVVSLPNNYQGLSVLQLNTELSASELFDKHGLIHIGDNLYHKVSQEKDNAELYEYLYKEVVEGRKNIPIRFQNKNEAQDVLNKEKVLQDISKFVNNRETGIEVVDRENLSLNQLVFDHTPIPKPEINAVKNKVGSIVTEDTNYLKTDFITDFYQYVLEEKIKDTELYRKVLSKFKFTDAGITLDGYVPSLEGIKYLEEFQDYIRLKRSTEMDYLVENTNLADDNKTFINQPDLLEEYRGSAILDTGYVITAPNFEDYIKVSGKLYKKAITESLAHLYAPVINEVDNVYYDTEATVLFDKSEAGKILKNYNKTSENTLSTQNAKDLIKKSGVESSLYKKIKAKAKEITKSLGFNIIGEQGATNLDRQQEVSYRLNNLLIAKEMQDKGMEASKIKLSTGWEQMNGEWMYEVEDVFFNDNFEPEVGKEYNYLDIVKPNEFTKAYPQLKNVKIKFNNDGTNSFTEDGGTINIDAQGFTKGISGAREQPTPSPLRPRGIISIPKSNRIEEVLNHESTHFAQRQEGFYTGGSPKSIIRRGYELAGVQEEDDSSVIRLKIFNKYNESDLTQSDKNILRSILLEYQQFEGSLAQAYNAIAGEAVARDVERRMDLSPQEKLNSLLKDTEIDVREEDKIFLRGTDISNKIFEKNLVEFIREKGVQVVTDPTEVQRVLKESGLDINPMISITNDLGIVERPTIKINGNTITVKEDVSSPRIKTLGAAVEVTDRIYAKVVNKLKEIAGSLYKPSFVTKTATTITLNVPVDIKEKAQELKDYYEEVYQIMADEALQEETIDDAFRKDVISELRRGATITQLKSFGYNFLQTPAGNVLGFEKNGVIYLDEAQLNNTTTLHELTHVFQSMLDIKASKGDKKAQDIINKRKELFQPMVEEWKKFHEGKTGLGGINTMVLGAKLAESLDYLDSKINRTANLEVAKIMENEGKTPIEIKRASLWERGADGEWRTEIPDGKFKNVEVGFGVPYNLSDIFEGEEVNKLFGNIKIIFDNENLQESIQGVASVENGTITLNWNRFGTMFNTRGGKAILNSNAGAKINEVLAHELTHFIQESEGFERGGNSSTVVYTGAKFAGLEPTDTIEVAVEKINEKLKDADNNLKKVLHVLSNVIKSTDQNYTDALKIAAYELLAGEVEARNVASRVNLTEEEKMETLLEATQDTRKDMQIFLKPIQEDLNFYILSPETQQLKDTIGLDLSSPAYAQRANESSEEWNTRLLKEVEAYVTAPEIAAKLEELKNNDPSLWKQITDFIKQLTDWLKSQIGLSDYKGNVMDMSKDEYVSALGISVLKDDYKTDELLNKFEVVKGEVNVYRGNFNSKGVDEEYTIQDKSGNKKYRFRLFYSATDDVAYVSDILKLDKNDKSVTVSEILPLIIKELKSYSEDSSIDYKLYLDPVISKEGKKMREILLKNNLVIAEPFTFSKKEDGFDKGTYEYDSSFLYKVNDPVVAFNIESPTYTEKQEMIKEFSTILDNHVEVVSLYNSEEEEDIYNEIDNCGI